MSEVHFDVGQGSDLVGRFADGSAVRVERSRCRAYPGLSAEAPSTVAFYEFACEALEGARRVLDLGSGAGAGSAILAKSFDEVVGVDRDESAVQFARRFAERAVFTTSDGAVYRSVSLFDAAVVIDVLGHVESPYETLRALRRSVKEGSKILVAESSAYPTQSLHSPARRAFSVRSLRALLAATGFEVEHFPSPDGTFVACVAVATAEGPADLLARGGEGSAPVLEELSLSDAPRAVRVEASLSLADLLLSRGDGDGAGKAYFHARELDPGDPRPLAGLSQMSLAIGQPKDAVSLSSMALRLDPTDVSSVSVHAMAVEQAHPEEAFSAWRIAANLAPDHSGIVGRFVEIAVLHEDYSAALAALEKLRSYGDALGSTFHLLTASVLLAGGRRADALLEARLAVVGAPNDPNVKAFWDRMNAA
jgi:SAM-dependent methyltransferase